MNDIRSLFAPLKHLHEIIRSRVVEECELSSLEHLSKIVGDDTGDTIFAVDRVSEEILIEFFEREIASKVSIVLIAEGLENGKVVLPVGAKESNAIWRIVVDPIDGTRGLMYQKRSGWILTGVARNGGDQTTLADIEFAIQTEIPLVKQHLSDTVWSFRGEGAKAERYDRITGEVSELNLKPSPETTIEQGFAMISRFFPGARDVLAAIDEEIVTAALGKPKQGKAQCFEDQYISTGGQLYELMSGHDRFVADIRPLMQRVMSERGLDLSICCHPYDLCTELIARELGLIITDAEGRPLESPLSNEMDVAWVGYANQGIRDQIEPHFQNALRKAQLLDGIMYRIVEGNTHGLADVDKFIDLINDLPSGLVQYFDPGSDIIATRAPGRLDVMGGIADYSGSLVLEMPIAEATFAAIQKTDDDVFKIVSMFADGERFSIFEMGIVDFEYLATAIDYKNIREFFKSDRSNRWASYAAGAFFVLARELGIKFRSGGRVLISSKVPVGKGVSSSAAIEVAIMQAICRAYDFQIEPLKMALLCQKVENEIVGAPCGVMDQVAVNCGLANSLIALVCQPAEILGSVKIPDEIEFWGIDSGVRHSVSGSDYSSVRAGAFMGYRMIADLAGMKARAIDDGNVKVEDDQWNGYLANISYVRYEQEFSSALPEKILGAAFLERFGGTTDRITNIDPDKLYSVKAPTAHAIYESYRVNRFAELLRGGIDDAVSNELGELMFQTHTSYSACGLGERGTDLIVELARENRANGVFGARITGGGSGGTVAILAERGRGSIISKIAEQYGAETGRRPYIFHDSSPGCAAFGILKLSPIEASQTFGF